MAVTGSGWGGGFWGASYWGSGSSDLTLDRVEPIRENVVRLFFSEAPRFTGILDPHDASDPARYSINVVAGTVGNNGKLVRSVIPVKAEIALEALAGGAAIDVTTDRPFTPYPAQYIVAANGLIAASSGALLVPPASFVFFGLYRFLQPPALDTRIPSRDIANPQTRSAMLDPLPDPNNPLLLGTIVVDENGDYAFDEGITNLKKRIYRRLLTSRGRFAHLPTYGVGVPDQVKRLNIAAVRGALASDAQKQISEEPDVQAVTVRVVTDPTAPNLVRFKVRVKAKFSQAPIDVDIPFSATE
jgi:hypothetical protein